MRNLNVAGLLLKLGFWVCFVPSICMAETASVAGVPIIVPTVVVEKAHQFTIALPWFGQVESLHAVSIPARVDGLIVSIDIADETEVKQGDVLFTLAGKSVENKTIDLQQQLSQANKEIAIALDNLHLKRAQMARGMSTNEQVNLADNALSLTYAHASSAKQALGSLDIGTRITAPINGIFTARTVHIGQYVSAGMQLARIVDTHHIRIRASLFPPANAKIVGQKAIIHGPHGELIGKVSAAMPETTIEGGMQMWVSGDAIQTLPTGIQLSGELTQSREAIAVPETAIGRDDQNKAYVFIYEHNIWRKQQVTTGIRDQRWVEIRAGLQGGEKIANKNVYEMLYRDFSNTYHEPD